MFKIFKINELGEQNIKGLYLLKDKIDFSPYYQRAGNIWDTRKKQLLIDTIINEFDIPKFYLNYFIETNNELSTSDKPYAVIDGKQRLQAIFDFLNDEFPLDENFVYLNDESLKIANFRFSDLMSNNHHEIVSKIHNFVLDIVFIRTDEQDRLEELFIRLNGGVSLTNAEKRNAIGGYLNQFIRAFVVDHVFFLEKVKFKNHRHQFNDVLTKLLYVESKNQLVSLNDKQLEGFLKENKVETPEIDHIIRSTVEVIEEMSLIFQNKDKLLSGKGILPVYYQFVKNHAKNIDPQRLRLFFEDFDNLRLNNRKLNEPNTILQAFDFFNQQGVYTEKSLSMRHGILEAYFEQFLSTSELKPLKNVGFIITPDMPDNFDEF